ncbi:MAG TPA: 2-oxo-4-hydroxy-4-carboxy-5-ureidoimidazoline decarboxylase [Pyrinomonadaceae bacterium]|jgi:OHCU decarboxylase|nr:2-oxo-4-hydroxy-4-carboxy-5-ureidoimidazoline decarboxylase [Pyrinomonadaceae bacterium]
MDEALEHLNALPREALTAELLKCCGSTRWAQGVSDERPFRDLPRLLDTAERVWWRLGREDWLEAFRSHPPIGGKRAARETGEEARRWSEQEQAGTSGARSEVLDALADANRAYQQKFGFIFIVCATGKSADEMLALLQERLSNDPATELRIAATEQSRITRLRLEKLLKKSRESGV